MGLSFLEEVCIRFVSIDTSYALSSMGYSRRGSSASYDTGRGGRQQEVEEGAAEGRGQMRWRREGWVQGEG